MTERADSRNYAAIGAPVMVIIFFVGGISGIVRYYSLLVLGLPISQQ